MELVWVRVEGPPGVDELCAAAASLAGSALDRLQPPASADGTTTPRQGPSSDAVTGQARAGTPPTSGFYRRSMDQPGAAAAPRRPTDPPKAVRTAARLWSVLGGLIAISMVVPLSDPEHYNAPAASAVFYICYGVAMIVLARRLRRGHDTRITLALGSMLPLLGLFPALLVVPALVLQWRGASNAWFDSRPR